MFTKFVKLITQLSLRSICYTVQKCKLYSYDSDEPTPYMSFIKAEGFFIQFYMPFKIIQLGCEGATVGHIKM